jgi:PucR C-terminal helix-turn-helix domain
MVHPAAALSNAVLRARLGDVIPQMIDVVVARLAETSPPRLLDAIVSDPSDSALVATLAGAAGWTLPRRVAVILLAGEGVGRGSGPGLPRDMLADWTRPEPVLVLPDPDGPGRRDAVDRALRGRHAVIGPAVPLADAARSLRWARQAVALSQRGILGGDPVRCEEHLSTLMLLADTDLVRTLLRSQLAPLAGIRPGQRERVAQTMLAWLQLGQNAAEVAQHLHVHPQTVRYRLRRIQELFGDQLRDPHGRFELVLALRARELLGGSAP